MADTVTLLEPEARRKLARSRLIEGRGDEAADIFSQILEGNPRDPEALSHLASYHLERGDLKRAGQLFQALLAVQPGHRLARYQLGALQALLDQKRWANGDRKMAELYEKLAQPGDLTAALGLRREHVPCLIEMNGDLLWMPGDLLRFLWHTVQKPIKSSVPSFRAETEHYLWTKERISTGDVVLDVGSNLGIFATMMGAKVGSGGRVFAFEPSPRIASDLRRVLALNELRQVTVVEAAVCDRNGEASFCEIEEEDVRRESSHLSNPDIDRALSGFKQAATVVRTVALDDFVAEHGLRPSLLKIDVEGAEFAVLEGARRTIAACRPALVIEIHPDPAGNFDHGRLTGILERAGYRYRHEGKTYFCGQPT